MKKRSVIPLIVLVLLALLVPSKGPSSASQAYQTTGHITASDVYIRSGPGRDHDAYGRAGAGDVIHIVSQTVGEDGAVWYYGQVNGISGWVCGAYVSASGAYAPTAAPVQPWGGGSALAFTGFISSSSANVRSAAGTGGAVIARLDGGSAVLVLSAAMDTEGALWYYCEYASGRYGYIRSDLVRAGSPVPTAGPTAMPVNPVSFTGYTNAGAVNVRSLPEGTKTDQLRKGVKVQVTGEVWVSSVMWYRVTYSGGSGYIRSDLISRSAPSARTPEPAVHIFSETPLSFAGTVLKDNCNIRLMPYIGAEVLLRVSAGAVLQVEALCTDSDGSLWYRIRTAGGTAGYILADLVTPSGGAYGDGAAWGGQAVIPDAGLPGGQTVYPDTGFPGGQAVYPDAGFPGGQAVIPDAGITDGQIIFPDAGGVGGQTVIPDIAVPDGQTVIPDTGLPEGASGLPDAGYFVTPTPVPDTLYFDPQTAVPGALAPDVTFAPPAAPEAAPTPDAPPVSEETPASEKMPFITSGPTAPPASGTPAERSEETEPLNFGSYASAPGQTLSVFSAPSVIAWRVDGGAASVTTTDYMWCAGYDGQWLLILYSTSGTDTRVGYVSALSLQGGLPQAPQLDFDPVDVTVLSPTKLTSDPMGRSDEVLALDAGSRVTWLCDCFLGSAWSYVESDIAGMPVRGFVPQDALSW